MKKTTILSLTLITLLLGGSLVFAFVLFDPPVKWASGDLPRNIEINQNGHTSVTDGDGGVSEIVGAIANSWNADVPGTLTATTTVSSPPATIGDGISTMHFNVVGSGCTGGCLAVTITPIPPSSPNETVNGTVFRLLDDSDIFFNPSQKFYSDAEPDGCKREFHIESTAVHEVGHLLGLDHTPQTAATMYAFSDRCDNSGESLHQDDIDGINCIYNNGYGCGGCVPDGTFQVDRTECSQPTRGRNKGDFLVETFIQDSCGNPAGGVLTRIDVVDPSLNNLFCEDTTGGSGRLGCAADNPELGLWTAEVTQTNGATPANCPGPACECSIVIN
jgi:hypothetical protein